MTLITPQRLHQQPPAGLSTSGFTLIESLIIIVIIGILAAIVAPTWKTLFDRQRVNTAQREILASFREAQFNAQRDVRDWQVCFRTQNGRVETLIHAQTQSDPVGCPTNDPRWRPLAGEISHTIQITNATLPIRNGYRSSRFLFNGRVTGAGAAGSSLGTGRIVITPKNQSAPQRCVFISTILGAARSAKGELCN